MINFLPNSDRSAYDSDEEWEKAMFIHNELAKISASWNADKKDNYRLKKIDGRQSSDRLWGHENKRRTWFGSYQLGPAQSDAKAQREGYG